MPILQINENEIYFTTYYNHRTKSVATIHFTPEAVRFLGQRGVKKEGEIVLDLLLHCIDRKWTFYFTKWSDYISENKKGLLVNARCPRCKQQVFYYTNENGSKVFFDRAGPPWPKHPCTDHNNKIIRLSGKEIYKSKIEFTKKFQGKLEEVDAKYLSTSALIIDDIHYTINDGQEIQQSMFTASHKYYLMKKEEMNVFSIFDGKIEKSYFVANKDTPKIRRISLEVAHKYLALAQQDERRGLLLSARQNYILASKRLDCSSALHRIKILLRPYRKKMKRKV